MWFLLVAVLLLSPRYSVAQSNKQGRKPLAAVVAEANGLRIDITSVENTRNAKYQHFGAFKGLYQSNLLVKVRLKNVGSHTLSVVNQPNPPRSTAALYDRKGKMLTDCHDVNEVIDYEIESGTVALKPGESTEFARTIYALKGIPRKGKYLVVVDFSGSKYDSDVPETRVNPETKREELYSIANRPPMWPGPEIQSAPYEITLK